MESSEFLVENSNENRWKNISEMAIGAVHKEQYQNIQYVFYLYSLSYDSNWRILLLNESCDIIYGCSLRKFYQKEENLTINSQEN